MSREDSNNKVPKEGQHMTENKDRTPLRFCVEDCGLLAAPGDVYCTGCRSSVDEAAAWAYADDERVLLGGGA